MTEQRPTPRIDTVRAAPVTPVVPAPYTLEQAQGFVTGLQQALKEVTAERDHLRTRLRAATDTPGYRTTTHGPLFLEPAVIADGHWDDNEEDDQ